MKVHISTYGCQMNKYDSQLIAKLLNDGGYTLTEELNEDSDAVIINTCSVREHAENRVLSNINQIAKIKSKNPDFKIIVAGCMAERLGDNLKIINKNVDAVFPPNTYRDLDRYLSSGNGYSGFSCDPLETYNEITPVPDNRVTAFVAIMRGCNNYCSYCIVPYVRGPERSRPADDVIDETKMLVDMGYREITFLGQNVNSYKYGNVDFAGLLEKASLVKGLERIRFLTSHPKDISENLIDIIAEKGNIANQIHLPLQSGSNAVLERMNRNYTREHYLDIVEKARKKIKDLFISTDIISGFPGETEKDHKDTVDIVKNVVFESAFTYKYSPRKGTKAYNYSDDVPEKIKVKRLNEISSLQREISKALYDELVGSRQKIIIENKSKKNETEFMGRTDGGIVAIVPGKDNGIQVGDVVNVLIKGVSGQTLRSNKI